jgi:hypothetical protein
MGTISSVWNDPELAQKLIDKFEAIYAEPPDTDDPGEMTPERWTRSLFDHMFRDRLLAGAPVQADDVEAFLATPTNAIRADLEAMRRMSSHLPESLRDVDDGGREALEVGDPGYIAQVERKHARLRAFINRQWLEVFRGYDLAVYPDLADKIVASISDLERLIKDDDRLAGESPGKAVSC